MISRIFKRLAVAGMLVAASATVAQTQAPAAKPLQVIRLADQPAAEVSYAVVWVAGRGAGTAQVQTVATRSRFVVPALPNGMPAIATID